MGVGVHTYQLRGKTLAKWARRDRCLGDARQGSCAYPSPVMHAVLAAGCLPPRTVFSLAGWTLDYAMPHS